MCPAVLLMKRTFKTIMQQWRGRGAALGVIRFGWVGSHPSSSRPHDVVALIMFVGCITGDQKIRFVTELLSHILSYLLYRKLASTMSKTDIKNHSCNDDAIDGLEEPQVERINYW
jgi:hypothetical protein